jgi:hypothetical protein
MRQMVLDALAVPKPPLYTRVATIELKQPEADARLTPARWREVFPDDVDTTGWCEEDYEELTMIYSCAVDRRSGQKYVASATGLWKVLPTLLPVLGLPQLVCGSGGERRGKGHMDGAGDTAVDGPQHASAVEQSAREVAQALRLRKQKHSPRFQNMTLMRPKDLQRQSHDYGV